MNTGLSSRLHPRKSSFVLSWSSASATWTIKAQDTKRAFKPNFPNLPVIRPKAKFFELQQIWYQNAPIGSLGKLLKHPCGREIALLVSLIVRKSLKFFVNKPEAALFWPVFWLPWNRITLTLNMLNFPILWPFSIFYVLLRKRRQNVQKLNNFKGVYVTRRDAGQIPWPFVKRDFDMLRILNLPIHA